MAAIEVGTKVTFDKNGPLYIFVGETEGFTISKRRMMSNVRIFLVTVSTKKRLETTTTSAVTGFSVLSANFP